MVIFAAVWGLLLGVVVGLAMLGLTSIDYVTYKGVVPEQAVMTGEHPVREWGLRCYSQPAEAKLFRVLQSRPGLSDTFTMTVCGANDPGPGDVVSIVRVGHGTDQEVMFGPPFTTSSWARFAATFAASAAAITFGCVLVATPARLRWRRWVDKGRARHEPT